MLISKRGTTMVESTVVFPLVIMCIAAVICILAFMYKEVGDNVRVHMEINKQRGLETETVFTYNKALYGVYTYTGRHNLIKCCFGEKTLRFQGRGLLKSSFSKNLDSRGYVVDEKKTIRFADFFGK